MEKRLVTIIEQNPRFALVGLVGILFVVLGVIDIAPAPVSLAVAASMAVGWCRWLDKSAALARK
jgi:hypothetical protein